MAETAERRSTCTALTQRYLEKKSKDEKPDKSKNAQKAQRRRQRRRQEKEAAAAAAGVPSLAADLPETAPDTSTAQTDSHSP